MSVCLMLRWVSISQAAAFHLNAKSVPRITTSSVSKASPPGTLTRGFAFGPTGQWGLRPRPPYSLAPKVRFAGRLGGINLHWLRMTPTLMTESFGLGGLYSDAHVQN